MQLAARGTPGTHPTDSQGLTLTSTEKAKLGKASIIQCHCQTAAIFLTVVYILRCYLCGL